MKTGRWWLGVLIAAGIFAFIAFKPLPSLLYQDMPYVGFLGRVVYIILLGALMCLFRLWRGPKSVDRITATDIMGILVVGFCAVLTIASGRPWYMDIAIAWALQSFICTLALAKYLEGKGFDE